MTSRIPGHDVCYIDRGQRWRGGGGGDGGGQSARRADDDDAVSLLTLYGYLFFNTPVVGFFFSVFFRYDYILSVIVLSFFLFLPNVSPGASRLAPSSGNARRAPDRPARSGPVLRLARRLNDTPFTSIF